MDSDMKRKMSAPRNPFVVTAKFKKAGAHRKPNKALRRAAHVAVEREAGREARHRTFNPAKDGFNSLGAHQSNDKSV